jgi:hypothetical protein
MSTDGLMSPNTPTLANGGAAGLAAQPRPDPGELDGIARPAPKPEPGNPRSRGHSPARDTYERAAQDQVSGEPGPAPSTGDPEPPPAPGEKVRVGEHEVTAEEFAAMMQRQAADDLKRATLPATPEAYKAELPPDTKLPGGLEYKFDASDPSLAAARNWAHAKGLSQGEFSEVLAIYASHVAGQEAALAELSRAEIAKAGPNATQRVDAVGKWITGFMGEKDGTPIRRTIVTDAHLRFYEKVITQLTNQGGASFSQQHRVPAEDRGIPGYDKMSFAERRFAQDQRALRTSR